MYEIATDMNLLFYCIWRWLMVKFQLGIVERGNVFQFPRLYWANKTNSSGSRYNDFISRELQRQRQNFLKDTLSGIPRLMDLVWCFIRVMQWCLNNSTNYDLFTGLDVFRSLVTFFKDFSTLLLKQLVNVDFLRWGAAWPVRFTEATILHHCRYTGVAISMYVRTSECRSIETNACLFILNDWMFIS